MSKAEINDYPGERGTEWNELSKRLREEANGICQRCRDHNGNYEYFPLSMEVHHIVRGRYLPISDARMEENLVVLCAKCHGVMEGRPYDQQFLEARKTDIANLLLSVEKEGPVDNEKLAQRNDMSQVRCYELLCVLRRLDLVKQVHGNQYKLIKRKE